MYRPKRKSSARSFGDDSLTGAAANSKCKKFKRDECVICGVAYQDDEDNSLWIMCDKCQEWEHASCAGFKKQEVPELFNCEKCELKISQEIAISNGVESGTTEDNNGTESHQAAIEGLSSLAGIAMDLEESTLKQEPATEVSREILTYCGRVSPNTLLGAVIVHAEDSIGDLRRMIAQDLRAANVWQPSPVFCLRKRNIPLWPSQNHRKAFEFFKSSDDYVVICPADPQEATSGVVSTPPRPKSSHLHPRTPTPTQANLMRTPTPTRARLRTPTPSSAHRSGTPADACESPYSHYLNCPGCSQTLGLLRELIDTASECPMCATKFVPRVATEGVGASQVTRGCQTPNPKPLSHPPVTPIQSPTTYQSPPQLTPSSPPCLSRPSPASHPASGSDSSASATPTVELLRPAPHRPGPEASDTTPDAADCSTCTTAATTTTRTPPPPPPPPPPPGNDAHALPGGAPSSHQHSHAHCGGEHAHGPATATTTTTTPKSTSSTAASTPSADGSEHSSSLSTASTTTTTTQSASSIPATATAAAAAATATKTLLSLQKPLKPEPPSPLSPVLVPSDTAKLIDGQC